MSHNHRYVARATFNPTAAIGLQPHDRHTTIDGFAVDVQPVARSPMHLHREAPARLAREPDGRPCAPCVKAGVRGGTHVHDRAGTIVGSAAGRAPEHRTTFGVTYNSETRMLLARFRSSDPQVIWECLETIGNEVGRCAVEGVLFDVRNSNFLLVAPDANSFAAQLATILGRRRFAYVTRTLVQSELAVLIATDAWTRRVSVKVFRNEQEAESWLCSSDPA